MAQFLTGEIIVQNDQLAEPVILSTILANFG